jgi:hypothetical protein
MSYCGDQRYGVPTVSTFFGIAIRMYHNDHLPPHFHARYQGLAGEFSFDGAMVAGRITSRAALRLIREWAALHGHEPEANWRRIEDGLPVERIEPLR